jgi:hypothetical protein
MRTSKRPITEDRLPPRYQAKVAFRVIGNGHELSAETRKFVMRQVRLSGKYGFSAAIVRALHYPLSSSFVVRGYSL